ncbi:hypothetical protein AB0D38_42295 [Streptomyces sp. NPDC048279]|uniref:hypothetical protein n=1 Tax=Streptomyces sp. NPDC048279 TaxID=3154714 RepID=UPI00341AA450
MSHRICLTVDDAFQTGFDEPCEHQVPNPADCAKCRLTEAEIRRLAVLVNAASATSSETPAAAA